MVSTQPEPCPFRDTLELLGQRHVLEILRLLAARNPQRFTDLLRATGVNPKVLSDRLRGLAHAGILYRKAYAEIPPRVEYGLTEKGQDLVKLFDHLAAWHERYP